MLAWSPGGRHLAIGSLHLRGVHGCALHLDESVGRGHRSAPLQGSLHCQQPVYMAVKVGLQLQRSWMIHEEQTMQQQEQHAAGSEARAGAQAR